MMTKYASLEVGQILDIKGSRQRIQGPSLSKIADFDNYRTEDGYLYARIRAISSRVNKNNDGWPSIELAGSDEIFDHHRTAASGFTVEASSDAEYGFSTFLGKPIFVDHHNSNPDRARGVIVDARLHVEDHKTASELDPYYASADVDQEHMPPTWVELLLEVDARSFPKLAQAIIDGSEDPNRGIDGFSMGCDVEHSICSICKNAATAPEEFCEHVKLKGATFDYYDDTGRKTARKAYENCYGVKFFEISAVFDPADETALLREIRSSVHKESMIKESPGKEHLKGVDSDKRQRQYEHIRDGYLAEGKSEEEAKELAARTVNKQRKEHGETKSGKIDRDQAKDLMKDLGKNFDLAEFSVGMEEELEHKDVTKGDLELTAQIVAAHLEEDSKYYTKLFEAGLTKMNPRTADNDPPQSDLVYAPENIDTLREEKVCPVCGSDMDDETCEICGYIEPPDNFNNPDLNKAQETDLRQESPLENTEENEEGESELQIPETPDQQRPKIPAPVAQVKSSKQWVESVRIAGKINPVERPLQPEADEITDEPEDEQVVDDQLEPVTSNVRTASELIAAAGNRKENMKTADTATQVAKPDVKTDATGAGGITDASPEAASSPDSTTEVTNKGGLGTSDVAADRSENVEQGDEYSRNIEGIPTDTWSDPSTQANPVSGQPFPASEEGVKKSRWTIQALSDEPYPAQDESAAAGGSAVQGTQPADAVGRAQDRVNVLDHVTSPGNNSGPTKTWTGTDGNGVTKQQPPVTPESIAQEVTSSRHLFSAFQLADLEVEIGLIEAERKYARVAELEQNDPQIVEATLSYARRVKQAGFVKPSSKTAKRMPSFRTRSKEATTVDSEVSDEALFA